MIRLDKITIKHIADEMSESEESMIGIMAEAEVSYPISAQGDRRIEWLSSGGIWGIEYDAPDDHIKELEEQELADLKEHLKEFGINVSNFDKVPVKQKGI